MEYPLAETNRQNAQMSTGPKTPTGKARSSKNALRHGVRSEVPVLPGEHVEDWDAHREGVLRSLAAVGALEQALADRVALCLWRQRRVTAYETAVTAAGLETVEAEVFDAAPTFSGKTDPEKLRKAEKAVAGKRQTLQMWERSLRLLQELADLPDDARVDGKGAELALQDFVEALPEDDFPDPTDGDFLAELGVPEDELYDPGRWDGWTAGMVRQALAVMAQHCKTSPEKVLARALEDRGKAQEEARTKVKRLEGAIKALRRRLRGQEDRLRRRRMLPHKGDLETITRYEAHLSRQMLQALHTLERLQAARAGQPVPPPAALDVTVDANEAAAAALAEAAAS